MVVSGQPFREWVQEAKAAAVTAKISISELDWLIQAVTGFDKLALRLATPQTQLDLNQAVPHLNRLWQQRLQERIPLQYLLGSVPWRTFSLQVAPGVLIPRPETEEIIDLAVQGAGESHLLSGHWVDLGTGSGAIALGLASVFPQATLHAVDCSPEALEIALENATRHKLASRIQFHPGYWWQPLKRLTGQISGMVSNPPYIPSQEVLHLQPEVSQHEPHLALDGGEDGLVAIRHLVATAPDYLQSGGVWLIEMMAGQGERVQALLQQQGSYRGIQVFKDINGIERFVLAYRV
ncbi:peptide chain release factor N(5)-glutamine methyltransferase [Spirulina sp. CS-785/01]|uniref:peptide chain release factor N(5)-glutamine methyltransferase n=1 Tax=Spirulina sp. CS-785/01 TaxID=3021716 RepID=UPI00232ED9A6|nr:peptide chain release factor N(5)-glutamine methyltransferase [Spirulina sp. CS-785/01]MDB9313009.1 peptide chain release factor N(5)-glutamine methyltransferase [Spirulina sp. CS-785/01]